MAEDDMMTPEEIKELRTLADRLNATEFENNLSIVFRAALEHIDQQAASLAVTEERVREHEAHENQTHDVLGKILGTDDTLKIVAQRAVDRIAELEAQVAALQEIAIEQKAAHIAFFGFHRNMNEDETKNKAQEEARRQLAEEHPEAFR